MEFKVSEDGDRIEIIGKEYYFSPIFMRFMLPGEMEIAPNGLPQPKQYFINYDFTTGEKLEITPELEELAKQASIIYLDKLGVYENARKNIKLVGDDGNGI